MSNTGFVQRYFILHLSPLTSMETITSVLVQRSCHKCRNMEIYIFMFGLDCQGILMTKIIITLCIFRSLNSKLPVKLADGKISRERTVYVYYVTLLLILVMNFTIFCHTRFCVKT